MLRLPDPSHRSLIVGRTGSGKTHFGVWLLSLASYTDRPWIVFDYKGDELIDEIPRMEEIDYAKAPPKRSGLYVIRPHITHDEAVEKFLWRIWEQENTGVFFDEGYMIPGKDALNAIYTQGRSKRIPAITLSQRPVGLTRFALSEADFFAIFQLNDLNDRKRVREFTGLDAGDKARPMPKHFSRWYDVSNDTDMLLSPAPDRDTILNRFYDRLAIRRRAL